MRGTAALLVTLLTLWTGGVRADPYIIIQSTTSTENSGLFDAILPPFEAATGIEARVVAVGTGQAIRNAERGDGDVLFVHDTAAEEAFVAAGFGAARHDVMYNDFVIVGPASDPAGIEGMKDVTDALTGIAEAGVTFVSRGDESGTHRAELRLWSKAGIGGQNPQWHRETGSGMGATLNVAVGLDGYTLTDRATWVAFGNKGAHRVLVEGDPALFNQYGVIAVAAAPSSSADAAEAFVAWITGEDGQAAIGAFRVDGQQVFFPNAQP
ncbi:MAG: substrate-binding domain-containing protein [Pseudomonadota bacterium]